MDGSSSSTFIRISGEGVAGAPERIPRKLVQQDQQRQSACWRFSPGIESTFPRRADQRAKTLADFGIERVILLEPDRAIGFAAFGKPEGENGFSVVHDKARSSSRSRDTA